MLPQKKSGIIYLVWSLDNTVCRAVVARSTVKPSIYIWYVYLVSIKSNSVFDSYIIFDAIGLVVDSNIHFVDEGVVDDQVVLRIIEVAFATA